MAFSSTPLNEELQCSICLNMFTDSVTTPCGHNFCRTCLNKCWTNTYTCFCPICKETFSRRPDLKINVTLREVVQHFEKLNQEESEVFCDFCDGGKQKAVKSCLTCQDSYCETHLKLHLKIPHLQKHKLVNALSKEQESQRNKTLTSVFFHNSTRQVHNLHSRIFGFFVLLAVALVCFEIFSTSPIKELQHEITGLKSRNTELEQILQMYPSKLTQTGLKCAQKIAVNVTLDPETAHPNLILSDDGKQVTDGDIRQKVPENPKRFDKTTCVLAKEGFSTGISYYEVQVKGKTKWCLGVVRESINRKERILPSTEKGFWTLRLKNGKYYSALVGPALSHSLKGKSEKIGVFVDYEEGLVSFYEVDSATHIYSFTGQTFTEKLYPYFNPGLKDKGENSDPLIITPVS